MISPRHAIPAFRPTIKVRPGARALLLSLLSLSPLFTPSEIQLELPYIPAPPLPITQHVFTRIPWHKQALTIPFPPNHPELEAQARTMVRAPFPIAESSLSSTLVLFLSSALY